MGRRKIEIATIHDLRNQQATFTKRKWGLMKKAYELSVLCDCDVGLVIFRNGQLSQYSNKDMQRMLADYEQFWRWWEDEGRKREKEGISGAAAGAGGDGVGAGDVGLLVGQVERKGPEIRTNKDFERQDIKREPKSPPVVHPYPKSIKRPNLLLPPPPPHSLHHHHSSATSTSSSSFNPDHSFITDIPSVMADVQLASSGSMLAAECSATASTSTTTNNTTTTNTTTTNTNPPAATAADASESFEVGFYDCSQTFHPLPPPPPPPPSVAASGVASVNIHHGMCAEDPDTTTESLRYSVSDLAVPHPPERVSIGQSYAHSHHHHQEQRQQPHVCNGSHKSRGVATPTSTPPIPPRREVRAAPAVPVSSSDHMSVSSEFTGYSSAQPQSRSHHHAHQHHQHAAPDPHHHHQHQQSLAPPPTSASRAGAADWGMVHGSSSAPSSSSAAAAVASPQPPQGIFSPPPPQPSTDGAANAVHAAAGGPHCARQGQVSHRHDQQQQTRHRLQQPPAHHPHHGHPHHAPAPPLPPHNPPNHQHHPPHPQSQHQPTPPGTYVMIDANMISPTTTAAMSAHSSSGFSPEIGSAAGAVPPEAPPPPSLPTPPPPTPPSTTMTTPVMRLHNSRSPCNVTMHVVQSQGLSSPASQATHDHHHHHQRAATSSGVVVSTHATASRGGLYRSGSIGAISAANPSLPNMASTNNCTSNPPHTAQYYHHHQHH